MIDLIKAIFIGAALIAGMLLIPIFMALLFPLLIFVGTVAAIWFFLQMLKEENQNEPPDPPPPP